MTRVADVCRHLDEFAPPATAGDWDNVGLLLGDAASPVERVMTCLTVTPAVVDEAVLERVGLIVSHHPILFRPVKRLSSASADGRLLWPLAKNDVAVHSPHSAFDNALGGINDRLAGSLGLTDVRPLRPREGAPRLKLVVFVPEADLARVSDAMFAAGAGRIGEYEQCSFRTAGTGTFFGGEASNPAVGEKGRREEVSELRLEVVCPTSRIDAVVSAMRSAHSYEEPAFDVYPLRPMPEGGDGRVGDMPAAMPLAEFARRVRSELKAGPTQFVGAADRPIQRVAIACGAAGSFLDDAVRGNADVFLTGEVRFHDCLSAESRGMAMVLPGHYATERPAVEWLADRLAEAFPALTVWPSRAEADAVTWV